MKVGFSDVWSRVSYAWKGSGALGMLKRFGRNDFNIVWHVIPPCLIWSI